MTDKPLTPIERYLDPAAWAAWKNEDLEDYTKPPPPLDLAHDLLAQAIMAEDMYGDPDVDKPINVELFPCAGGMAKGFGDAGVHFDISVELEKNHCDSYQHNIGHRPICIDARDFLRMCKLGFRRRVRLLVADPPCTPWSRSGKREGTNDPRDMLQQTCEIIRVLRPQAYLIGNVPGLDDGPNLHIVQRLIGGLSKYGYCSADFARLDAVNYGVPQHRIRPFWFGHLEGPCIQWPAPTHGDPKDLRDQLVIPGVEPLIPWITCGDALKHLSTEELGRPVKLRRRSCNGKQHGSLAEKPARVVGTSNLSDGNVVLPGFTIQDRRGGEGGLNTLDAPSHAVVRNTHGNGSILTFNDKHSPSDMDDVAHTLGARQRTNGANVLTYTPNHPPSYADEPGMTVRGGDGMGARVAMVIPEVADSGKHPAVAMDAPATTVRGGGQGHSPPALVLRGESTVAPKQRLRDRGRTGQGNRVGTNEKPGATITGKASRVGAGEGHVLEWPWDRPATTVQADDRLPPPGHHDESYAIMSLANAVVISELAATILQGFPEDWTFVGESKKARWSQIGQAMPSPLAYAVATSVVAQLELTRIDHDLSPTAMGFGKRDKPLRTTKPKKTKTTTKKKGRSK